MNNNAAALILLLSAHAAGRRSWCRAGLVEIGSSFRLPEIMEAGVKLVEVAPPTGPAWRTTSEPSVQRRPHPEGAPQQFLHPGLQRAPPVRDLTGLGLPVVEDIGSGMLWEAAAEHSVEEALQAGGAGLFLRRQAPGGGPQAGLILGREEWVQAAGGIRSIGRWLDKLSLVALEATLKLWEEERLPRAARSP